MLSIPPDVLGMIASLYGVGAAGAALLQARQVVRRRSSCEVSARFFATYAGGYAVWLLYGLSIDSVPLILVDAAGLACGLVTLAITLRMRGSLLRPSTWGSCPDNPSNAIDAGKAIGLLGERDETWRSAGPTPGDSDRRSSRDRAWHSSRERRRRPPENLGPRRQPHLPGALSANGRLHRSRRIGSTDPQPKETPT
jgi:uncharacterized protein with PQ loop repeat